MRFIANYKVSRKDSEHRTKNPYKWSLFAVKYCIEKNTIFLSNALQSDLLSETKRQEY